MIQCGLKEEIYPLMEEAAKPLLDMAADQRSTAFDNEGHWGGCLWRPVIFLASCRHGEAEATVENALRQALGKPRDIFQMNQGLLYALHFGFDGLNDTIVELFRQLVQKMVLRDQSDMPWYVLLPSELGDDAAPSAATVREIPRPVVFCANDFLALLRVRTGSMRRSCLIITSRRRARRT